MDAQIVRGRSRAAQARAGIPGEYRRGLQLPRQPPGASRMCQAAATRIITIAREARLLAGFTEEEIERLVAAARKSAAY